jgi:hypothetical protein
MPLPISLARLCAKQSTQEVAAAPATSMLCLGSAAALDIRKYCRHGFDFKRLHRRFPMEARKLCGDERRFRHIAVCDAESSYSFFQ